MLWNKNRDLHSKISIQNHSRISDWQTTFHSPNKKIFNKIWKSKGSPRVEMFIWKCLQDIVPTRESLGRRIHSIISRFSFCDQTKTLQHMLLTCPFSIAVWFSTLWGHTLDQFKNQNVSDWLDFIFDPPNVWMMNHHKWRLTCTYISWNL